jgi:hypothetical protein
VRLRKRQGAIHDRTLRYALLATAMLAGAAQAGARDELKAFTTGLKGLRGSSCRRSTTHAASSRKLQRHRGLVRAEAVPLGNMPSCSSS